MLDYLEGGSHCQINSQRLQATARIILKDSNGTDSFALFLYHIAYEEIAKAIFCLFVHRGWVKKDFVDLVFKHHEVKIFLYEEIFRSFEVNCGTAYLGGKPLGEIPLRYFQNQYESIIKRHRDKTNDFLYVGKNSQWKVPLVSIPDIESQEKEIQSKIHALDIIYEIVRAKLDEQSSVMNNFKFYEKGSGIFTIQYDSI